MNTLTDLYNQAIVPMDEELEKQATELVKQAEEEDAAGRIMARGFADEMNKLAGGVQAITGQKPTGTGALDPAVRQPSAAGGGMKALSKALPKQPKVKPVA